MNPAGPPAPSARRYVRVLIVIAALLLVVSMVLTGSGLTGTTQAQAERGAIPSMNLDSDEPGQLVITWETSDPHPTDYRLSWAHSSLGFLSYRDSNEAERGQRLSGWQRDDAHAERPDAGPGVQGPTPGPLLQRRPLGSRVERARGPPPPRSGAWTNRQSRSSLRIRPKTRALRQRSSPAEQTDNEDPPAAPTGLTVRPGSATAS